MTDTRTQQPNQNSNNRFIEYLMQGGDQLPEFVNQTNYLSKLREFNTIIEKMGLPAEYRLDVNPRTNHQRHHLFLLDNTTPSAMYLITTLTELGKLVTDHTRQISPLFKPQEQKVFLMAIPLVKQLLNSYSSLNIKQVNIVNDALAASLDLMKHQGDMNKLKVLIDATNRMRNAIEGNAIWRKMKAFNAAKVVSNILFAFAYLHAIFLIAALFIATCIALAPLIYVTTTLATLQNTMMPFLAFSMGNTLFYSVLGLTYYNFSKSFRENDIDVASRYFADSVLYHANFTNNQNYRQATMSWPNRFIQNVSSFFRPARSESTTAESNRSHEQAPSHGAAVSA